MQVFLPWPSFEDSQRAVDTVRLSKGIVEAYQLVRASIGLSRGHVNHPARTQFADRVGALVRYAEVGERILVERAGFGNIAAPKSRYVLDAFAAAAFDEELPPLPPVLADLDPVTDLGLTPEWAASVMPVDSARSVDVEPWSVGSAAFHLSHQMNLVAKRPDIYAPVFGVQSECYLDDPVIGHAHGDEDDLLVVPHLEPYLWPVTVEGVRLFQVGTKTDRMLYADRFDADPALRAALLVTPEEADHYYRVTHPDLVARFEARSEELRRDPAAGRKHEDRFAPELAARRPICVHLV